MTPSQPAAVIADQLVALLMSLPPWGDRDFTAAQWQRYVDVAAAFEQASPEVVETALSRFMRQEVSQTTYEGAEDESKPFLLMRVLFDLPESAPATERRSFKGWTNWPEPDSQGRVSLSWPVDWSQGRPRLGAAYSGSLGLPYDAAGEYRWLQGRYPLRQFVKPGRP